MWDLPGPCSLHWQADSYPRHPQGSPEVQFHTGLPSLSAERLWQVIQTCSLSIFIWNVRATLANMRQMMLSWDKWVRRELWELASLGSPGQLTWWRWALSVDFQGCTFFFLKYRVPQGGGTHWCQLQFRAFWRWWNWRFHESFRPQTQFCLELSNTPFDNGVPFPGVQFHGAGHPPGHSSSCPTMDCGLSHISGLYDSGVSHGCWHVWTSACHRKANFKINILGLP